MLKIKKNKEDKKLTVSLAGRLDTSGAPKLEDELMPSLAGVADLDIDLRELTYISSAGLRVFLAAQKVMDIQGQMVISGASDEVTEIFEDTGFIDILNLV